MNHHPRWKDLCSTAQLLREAASSFSANIITFLFLSLLILSFCIIIENDTTHVTSFIYRDPSLKALLSRLDLANNTNSNRFRSPKDPLSAAFRHHCHSPFLHLTRDGTLLDGDFFSSDDDDGRSLFRRNEKSSVNGGFVFFGSFNLKSGFLDIVIEMGLRFGK